MLLTAILVRGPVADWRCNRRSLCRGPRARGRRQLPLSALGAALMGSVGPVGALGWGAPRVRGRPASFARSSFTQQRSSRTASSAFRQRAAHHPFSSSRLAMGPRAASGAVRGEPHTRWRSQLSLPPDHLSSRACPRLIIPCCAPSQPTVGVVRARRCKSRRARGLREWRPAGGRHRPSAGCR